MSEINEDLKLSNLELSNNLGLILSSENASIKHTGEGDLNILSNNGDVIINSNNITLQATNDNIFINGGFVGNYEILSSNGNASLRTLTTFLNATSSSLNITLGAGQIGQIKNFVFYTRGDDTDNRVTIQLSGINLSSIALDTPGNTLSLLYTPLNLWSIISS